MDLEIIVLVGLPCSGKSTYASSLGDVVNIVSNDKIAREFFGCVFDPRILPYMIEIETQVIRGSITAQHKSVCVDNTNVTRKNRKRYIDLASELGVRASAVYLDVTLEEARLRNDVRKHVPDEVLVRMSRELEVPILEEGFYLIRRI